MTTSQSMTRPEIIAYAKEACRAKGAERFTDDDVTTRDYYLTDGAILWMRAYDGGMDFVHQMKAQDAKRGLTRGQLRGVLNCMRAAVAKEDAERLPAVVLDLTGIVALIEKARVHLKYPKVRLMTPSTTTILISVAGDKSRTPGAVMVTSEGGFYERELHARIQTDGRVERRQSCTDEIIELLSRFAADSAGVAAEFGRFTGYCAFCNSLLEDERSTSVGYGPVCAKNWRLPYPTRKEVRESAVA